MNPLAPGFDPIHFPRRASWKRRVSAWLDREEKRETNPHLEANAETIANLLGSDEIGLRMVVNVPASGLLGFIRDNKYKNAYERPVVAGGPATAEKSREPSGTRKEVDALLLGDKAGQYYFGAVAFGGTGVRFYGEYCLVLRQQDVGPSTRVFDRNSYDLVRPPLSDVSDKARLVRTLRGQWAQHLVDMVTLKILPKLCGTHRLITAGMISDATLHDEDFVEVHRRGSFSTREIEEVRVAPEDCMLQSDIASRLARGVIPTLTELLWVNRRALVEEELRRVDVDTRVVVSAGRGGRWK